MRRLYLIYGWSSSDQLRLFACHDRVKALHEQTREYLKDQFTSINETQHQIQAISVRMEQSQARMESQLQSILASQQLRGSPISSQNLNTSSPEGRETWMNLGRLLRAEGITPAIIQQNRDVLIRAMKITLQASHPSSFPESYHTAHESFSYRYRSFTGSSNSHLSFHSSTSILGSAPILGATFTDEFLDRHRVTNSLDKETNVEDGIRSLLNGMTAQENDEGGSRAEDSSIIVESGKDEDQDEELFSESPQIFL